MWHAACTFEPLTYPGSCKTCFFCIPVFCRKVSLIFPVIYLRSNLHTDLSNPLIFADSCPGWHNYPLWGFVFSFTVSWLIKMCFGIAHILSFFWHCIIPIDHAQTGLLVNCVGGTQGVHLPGWSNMGQIWAIRFWQVWGNWHPSIWWWSLWIGLSTCSHEPTLSKTEPASTQGTLQAHILQALKSTF